MRPALGQYEASLVQYFTLHRDCATFTTGCQTSALNGLSGMWYKSHDFKGFGGPVETTGLDKKIDPARQPLPDRVPATRQA